MVGSEKLHSKDTDSRAAHTVVSCEAQWTQPWPRVQSQVDLIHLMRSTSAIASNLHLLNVKSCPEKSRLIKNGNWMHSVMISIEYDEIIKNFKGSRVEGINFTATESKETRRKILALASKTDSG